MSASSRGRSSAPLRARPSRVRRRRRARLGLRRRRQRELEHRLDESDQIGVLGDSQALELRHRVCDGEVGQVDRDHVHGLRHSLRVEVAEVDALQVDDAWVLPEGAEQLAEAGVDRVHTRSAGLEEDAREAARRRAHVDRDAPSHRHVEHRERRAKLGLAAERNLAAELDTRALGHERARVVDTRRPSTSTPCSETCAAGSSSFRVGALELGCQRSEPPPRGLGHPAKLTIGSMDDTARFFERALALAGDSLGGAHPNPTVGAVVVLDGEIVGVTEGYRGRHGEVVALAAAGDRARGAAVYVTLEPCNHQGSTPPCTDALLEAGVARVVAGQLDPNPNVLVAGSSACAGWNRGRARRRRACVPLPPAARGVADLDHARGGRS